MHPTGTATLLRHLHHLATPQPSDRELLRRFADRHDEAAFDALVRRHGRMVLAVCRRALGNAHDAEDAFQATFRVLATRAASAPWQESVAGWLHGVAHHVALKARAAAARRRRWEAPGAGPRRRRPAGRDHRPGIAGRPRRGAGPAAGEIPGRPGPLLPRRQYPRRGRPAARLAAGHAQEPGGARPRPAPRAAAGRRRGAGGPADGGSPGRAAAPGPGCSLRRCSPPCCRKLLRG
jgi:hypothetical protein